MPRQPTFHVPTAVFAEMTTAAWTAWARSAQLAALEANRKRWRQVEERWPPSVTYSADSDADAVVARVAIGGTRRGGAQILGVTAGKTGLPPPPS